MAAYEAAKAELDALDVTVYAVSADNEEQAREVQGKGLSFPVAYGATKADADAIGAWWSDDRGGYVQPARVPASAAAAWSPGPCTPPAP